MLFSKTGLALLLGSLFSVAAFAQKGETVKIAFIDPMSGLMAPPSRGSSK